MCPPIDHLEHLTSHWHPTENNYGQSQRYPVAPPPIYSFLPPHEYQCNFKGVCLVEPRRSPSLPTATVCIEWMANAFSSTDMDPKLVDNCTTQDNGTCLWQGGSPLCVCALQMHRPLPAQRFLSVLDVLAPACCHPKYELQTGTMHETQLHKPQHLLVEFGKSELCVKYGVDILTVFLGCSLRCQCGCRQVHLFHSGILTCLASWARCVLTVDFACPRNAAGVSNTHANSKSTAARFCAVLDDDGLLHGPKIGPSFALFASPSTGAEAHGPKLSHARLLPDAWHPCSP
jgi:hypothetical protein